MYTINKCICCGSESLVSSYGLVSPFISQYVFESPPSICRIFTCNDCGFRFFEQRFEDKEVERLYHDYRGLDYYSVRHEFEPWYTKSINDAIGHDKDTITIRKQFLSNFLRAHIPLTEKVKRLLDYGGDLGQFIPENIAEECYVYEVSGVTPISGVTRIDDMRDLEKETFDIVILSMVLEHVSDPRMILQKIHDILAPGGYLCLEVPYEPLYYRNWLGTRTDIYLNLLANSPTSLVKTVDLYSLLFRIKFHCIPPLGFVKLHEHINFFSEASFYPLLQSAGFSVISIEKHYQNAQSGINSSFMCLAKVNK